MFYVLHKMFKVILTRRPESIIDVYVYKWSSYSAQYCMHGFYIDNYPRTLYFGGIFWISNLKLDDEAGIIFCFVEAFLLEIEEMMTKRAKMSDNRCVDIFCIIQMMLCCQAWLNLKINENNVEKALFAAEKAIKNFYKVLSNINQEQLAIIGK